MAASLTVSWTWPYGENPIAAVSATRQVSAGRSSMPRSAYKLIAFADAQDTTVDIITPYVARFGPLKAGQKVFVEVVTLTDTGLASAIVNGSAVIT